MKNTLIIADNFFTRLRGLLFRRPLVKGEGLVLIPCNSIHTFGMGYPIDVVFLDRDYQIVRLVRELPARKMRSASGARMVLELPPGGAGEMKEGDTLSWLKDIVENRR